MPNCTSTWSTFRPMWLRSRSAPIWRRRTAFLPPRLTLFGLLARLSIFPAPVKHHCAIIWKTTTTSHASHDRQAFTTISIILGSLMGVVAA